MLQTDGVVPTTTEGAPSFAVTKGWEAGTLARSQNRCCFILLVTRN